jgi:LysM repeat protein
MTTIWFILLLTGVCRMIYAQVEPALIKQTDNKIILEGKIYYLHIVKEGETLVALSKAYNVQEKIIALENPDIFAGLQVGMTLKIPEEPVDLSYGMESDEYVYHVIREGETLYSLSRRYDVNIDEIKKHNPEVEYSELQINQLIRIPKVKQPDAQQELRDDNFNHHLVKQGETLFSLSRLYQVSIEELKKVNPDLQWGPLKYDEYIRIPLRAEPELVADTLVIEPVLDTTRLDSLEESMRRKWIDILLDSSSVSPPEDEIHIGLFLPLLLHWDELMTLSDTLVATEPESAEKKKTEIIYHPLTIGFLEFYEGVLLAIDSLKKTGLSVTLHTYDTEKNPDVLQKILATNSVSQLDLIIGPVDQRNVRLLSDFSARNRIPMISPFVSIDELVGGNPFLIQMQPSSSLQTQNFADYLSSYLDRTIIFIYNGDSADIQRGQDFRKGIINRISERTFIDDTLFREMIFTDSLPSDFYLTLTVDTQNIIIIPSVREAEVSNILTSIYFIVEDQNITVLGMYNWPRFHSIDLELYHELQLHYFTSFFVDYKNGQVKEFIKKFDQVYSIEPYLISSQGYNLAMLAYDIMLYFCPVIQSFGENMIFNLDRPDCHPMMGDYKFRQLHPFSGHVNQFTMLITYKTDLTIEQIIPEDSPSFYERVVEGR